MINVAGLRHWFMKISSKFMRRFLWRKFTILICRIELPILFFFETDNTAATQQCHTTQVVCRQHRNVPAPDHLFAQCHVLHLFPARCPWRGRRAGGCAGVGVCKWHFRWQRQTNVWNGHQPPSSRQTHPPPVTLYCYFLNTDWLKHSRVGYRISSSLKYCTVLVCRFDTQCVYLYR